MAVNNSLAKKEPQGAKKTGIVEYDANGVMVSLSPELVRNYLVSGNKEAVSINELVVFMNLCRFNGLNPWLKEAYCIKYGNEPAAMVIGKEAFQKRAESTPAYDGNITDLLHIVLPAKDLKTNENRIAYISFTSARYIIYSDIDETSHYAQAWSLPSSIHDVVSLAQYVFPAGYLAIPSAYYMLAGPDVALGVSGESFIINDQEYFIPGNTGSNWRIAIELPNLEQS